jgi:predicted SprT family Zn-dependent metalloprotease
MLLKDATTLATQLIETHLGHLNEAWTLKLNKRRSALGVCNFEEKTIYLSTHFIEHNSIEQVKEIILHEIAHALAGRTGGHGPQWVKQCRRLGIEPRVTYHEPNMPPGKYVATCKKCERRYNKQYKPATGYQYICPNCKVLIEFKVYQAYQDGEEKKDV